MLKEFLFQDRAALFTALAAHCQQHLAQTLRAKDSATLLVSGGSTPAPLYERLSRSALDWRNIHVALVDERWVDSDHAASNEALIKRTLLRSHAANAPFTGMKNSALHAAQGCAATETAYCTLPQPYTVTVLGMGSDGHTASLFPHAQGLAEALNLGNPQLTAAIIARQSEVTGPNTERLTLTLHGLLQSERLILLLTGADKLQVFRSAQGEGAVEDMPVRALLRQDKVPLELYWAP